MKRASGKVIKFVAMLAMFSGGVIVLSDTMNRAAKADTVASAKVGVGVTTACTFGASTHEHSLTITPGTYQPQIGEDTVFTAGCNDQDGYVVYAVGYGNEEEGTTTMIGSGTAQGISIKTGTATNGEESNWVFRVHDAAEGLVIQGDYGQFAAVPEERTAVVKRESLEGVTGLDRFSVTYAAYVTQNQVPGTYSGKVLYTLFNPSSHGPKPVLPMQNYDCSSLANVGDTATLTDTRDGNTYTVRKLSDGLCWMTQNLRIGSNSSTTVLDSTTSDVASTWTLPAGSTSGFNSTQYDTQHIYIDNTYGGYYTWYSATAGEGTQSKSSGDTSHSICPKGWRLPTSAEITAVTENSNNNSANKANGNFNVYSGSCYQSGCPYSTGSGGRWWSSTASSSSNAYILYSNSSTFYLNRNYAKGFGYSVRCVAREPEPEPEPEPTTMDTFTYDYCTNSMEEGQTLELTDSRDGNTYRVRKLADGKCWMIDNLKLGRSTTMQLTPNDSDVTSNYTLPASSTSGFSSNTAQNVYVDATWGGYYTWMAATAGSGGSSGNAAQSICPKGWRLPTGGSGGDFQVLNNALGGNTSTAGSNALQAADGPSFVLSGYYYYYGSPGSQGSYGYYWSSTAYNSDYAYYLNFGSSRVNPTNYNDKDNGFAVRCVAW